MPQVEHKLNEQIVNVPLFIWLVWTSAIRLCRVWGICAGFTWSSKPFVNRKIKAYVCDSTVIPKWSKKGIENMALLIGIQKASHCIYTLRCGQVLRYKQKEEADESWALSAVLLCRKWKFSHCRTYSWMVSGDCPVQNVSNVHSCRPTWLTWHLIGLCVQNKVLPDVHSSNEEPETITAAVSRERKAALFEALFV